jgi:hypothetical protein
VTGKVQFFRTRGGHRRYPANQVAAEIKARQGEVPGA